MCNVTQDDSVPSGTYASDQNNNHTLRSVAYVCTLYNHLILINSFSHDNWFGKRREVCVRIPENNKSDEKLTDFLSWVLLLFSLFHF